MNKILKILIVLSIMAFALANALVLSGVFFDDNNIIIEIGSLNNAKVSVNPEPLKVLRIVQTETQTVPVYVENMRTEETLIAANNAVFRRIK